MKNNIQIQVSKDTITYTEPAVPFFKTAEFWVMVVDAVVAILVHVLAEYTEPAIFDQIKFVIDQLQPVVLVVIGGLFAERAFTAHSRRMTFAKLWPWFEVEVETKDHD